MNERSFQKQTFLQGTAILALGTVLVKLIGFLFKKLHISPAPMALGIILGSLVELNYRRGLMAGKYSLSLFLTRPVSAALAILLVIFVVLPIVRDKRSKAKSKTE